MSPFDRKELPYFNVYSLPPCRFVCGFPQHHALTVFLLSAGCIFAAVRMIAKRLCSRAIGENAVLVVFSFFGAVSLLLLWSACSWNKVC